jgi:hypothetical protein
MLTVIWGIDGFCVVDLMTEQHNYSTQSFLSHILEPLLLVVFPDGHKPHSRRLSLHLNKCRVHRSKASVNSFAENSIIRVCHPLYSPDLTPSDFWLLTFRAHEDGTGKTTVPRVRGSSHWHSGISEWNLEVWIGTRISPWDRVGSMDIG